MSSTQSHPTLVRPQSITVHSVYQEAQAFAAKVAKLTAEDIDTDSMKAFNRYFCQAMNSLSAENPTDLLIAIRLFKRFFQLWDWNYEDYEDLTCLIAHAVAVYRQVANEKPRIKDNRVTEVNKLVRMVAQEFDGEIVDIKRHLISSFFKTQLENALFRNGYKAFDVGHCCKEHLCAHCGKGGMLLYCDYSQEKNPAEGVISLEVCEACKESSLTEFIYEQTPSVQIGQIAQALKALDLMANP